jgi:putative membrane protein
VFIDYVTLLLLNMVAGHFLLAWYVAAGLDSPEEKHWGAAFGMVGLIALVFGGAMVLTWPLPGPYGSIFGEMSVLLGIIFLGAGLAIGKGWDLRPVALYAFFAGLAAMVLGVRILVLGLTKVPILTAVGFLASGFGGVMALPTLLLFKSNRLFRLAAAAVLVLAGLCWVATVFPAYWAHAEGFKNWVPFIVPGPPAPGH